MKKEQSEIEKLLSGLPQEQQAFQEEPTIEQIATPEEESEDEPKGRKNRAYRRLEEKYQKEREAAIQMAERIKVLAEVKEERQSRTSEIPAEWLTLHGDTPEARKAWAVEEQMLERYAERAKQEALKEFQEQQDSARNEQKEFESLIDSQLEALEDEHDIDLTSNAPKARKMRTEFLELVGKLSPKDAEGNPTQYADFASTFELYKEQREAKEKPDNSRQKELASRSMQRPTGNESQAPTGRISFNTAKQYIDSLRGN